MKTLQEQKDELIAQMEAMSEVLNKENRTAFNEAEKKSYQTLKTQVTDINSRIEEQKFLDEQKRTEVKNIFTNSGLIKTDNQPKNEKQIFRSGLKNFLQKKRFSDDEKGFIESRSKKIADNYSPRGNEFYIPQRFINNPKVEYRTPLLSSNSVTRTDQEDELSFAGGPIIYKNPKFGAKIYNDVDGSKLDLPSLADYSITIASENGSVTNAALTTAKVTATAQAITVTAGFSRSMIASTNEDILDDILNTFSFVIDKAIDNLVFAALTGLTPTLTNVSGYSNILTLEANLKTVPNVFLSSFKGRNFWKKNLMNPAGTTAEFTWDKDNEVIGYNAIASPYCPSNLVALLDGSSVAVVKFGDLIMVEDIYSQKATNTIEYSLIQMADVKIVNSAFIAMSNGGSFI